MKVCPLRRELVSGFLSPCPSCSSWSRSAGCLVLAASGVPAPPAPLLSLLVRLAFGLAALLLLALPAWLPPAFWFGVASVFAASLACSVARRLPFALRLRRARRRPRP